MINYHFITKENEALKLFQGTVSHLLISECHKRLSSQVSHLSNRYLNDLAIGHKQVIQWDLHLYVPTYNSVVNRIIYKWEMGLPWVLTFSLKFLTYKVGTGFTAYYFSPLFIWITPACSPDCATGGWVRRGGGMVGGGGGRCLAICWKVYCILNSITFCNYYLII